MGPRTLVSTGNDAADELARRVALLAPSHNPSYPLSSFLGLSHLNSLTHRFLRFPPRNLYSLVTLAVSSLVYAAMDTACCQALISLELAESRILPAAPADTLVSFCTVQLGTLCHSTTSGSCPISGAPWSSAILPSLGRGRVTKTTTFCCCCLPDPFRGMGAWRMTMEPQKPGNSPGSGPEVVKTQRVAKE